MNPNEDNQSPEQAPDQQPAGAPTPTPTLANMPPASPPVEPANVGMAPVDPVTQPAVDNQIDDTSVVPSETVTAATPAPMAAPAKKSGLMIAVLAVVLLAIFATIAIVLL